MRITPLLLALALCCIAANAQTTNAEVKLDRHHRAVLVESDPPGMRIYFCIAGSAKRAKSQRAYMGLSPCSVIVECDGAGRFVNNVSNLARPKAVFEAEAPAGTSGLFSQEQTFSVPALLCRPPPIPKGVFFDMHKSPP